MDKNRQQLIYDLPTRIFHWAFAFLFVCSFLIAKFIDDENPLFFYHMLLGLLLGSLTILRIVWGILGTRYARFSSFVLKPSDLLNYFKNIFSSKSKQEKRWPGHNPASSWAALIMMISALALAASGILMSTGAKESFEDIHEFFANLFLITAVFHVVGVLFHSLKHQDNIGFSMITGKKQMFDDELKISSSQTIVAIFFLFSIALFSGYLITHYNSSTQELNLFGRTLFLDGEKKVDRTSHQEEIYDE